MTRDRRHEASRSFTSADPKRDLEPATRQNHAYVPNPYLARFGRSQTSASGVAVVYTATRWHDACSQRNRKHDLR